MQLIILASGKGSRLGKSILSSKLFLKFIRNLQLLIIYINASEI